MLREIYNAFDPARPLLADDPTYVDCRDARGDRDILQEVGREILWSDRTTCQLYAGHRGSGKSTELLRLKKYLEDNDYKVVYFAADEQDIDPEDARYTDILLACTRHLLEDLKGERNPKPLLDWLKDRWQALKDLATTEVEFEKLNVTAQISQFAKLTANLRAVPSTRQKIREQVNAHTVSLLGALNEFISEARPTAGKKLVVIVDNLDRIVPVYDSESKRTNHDEIFIDRSEQLAALQCYTVYTVPISMVYSASGVHLEDRYGRCDVLPMVSVRERATLNPWPRGIATLKDLILKRVQIAAPAFDVKDLFENDELATELCLMGGGHMRNTVLLMRTALERTRALPIPTKAVHRAMAEMRETYRKAISENEWEMLAKVALSKQMPNEEDYHRLLFNRCILEYREIDEQQKLEIWHDVHPLIEGIGQFQRSLENAKNAV